MSETPYKSVQHALKSAYAMEARDSAQVSAFLRTLRGGVVGSSSPFWDGLDVFDRVAQAAITIALARRSLGAQYRDVIDAKYTIPESVALTGRKELGCRVVSFALWEKMDKLPDRWYLADVCREWAGLKRQLTDAQWADRIAKTDRTLRNWRHGRGYMAGAMNVLDDMLGRAHVELVWPMKEAKLIP